MKTETKSQRVQLLMRPSTYEGLKTIAKGMLVSTNEAINVILEGYIHPIAPKGGPAQNARVEDASDTEAMRAAETIQKHCEKHFASTSQCDCNFETEYGCRFYGNIPKCWKLPHRKTRKELLLEKFPNATINGIGTPELCAKQIFGGKCNGNCEACWNAPAESEEDK